MTAKRNRLAPKNVESLIVIKENMAMVENFLKNGGYEIEKSQDDSNPFAKIDIEETERVDDLEDYFNGEGVDAKEEDLIYLEDVDDSEADSEEEDDKEDLD